jgi:hypothetical protein
LQFEPTFLLEQQNQLQVFCNLSRTVSRELSKDTPSETQVRPMVKKFHIFTILHVKTDVVEQYIANGYGQIKYWRPSLFAVLLFATYVDNLSTRKQCKTENNHEKNIASIKILAWNIGFDIYRFRIPQECNAKLVKV